MILKAKDGHTFTSNVNSEDGVYLNVYGEWPGLDRARVDLTPGEAMRLAKKLRKYARKAGAR